LLSRDQINRGRDARCQAEFVMGGDDRRFPGGCAALDREADSEGFELHSHESEVVDFVRGVNRDEEALVRLRLDQALFGKTRQRFAHDAYADAAFGAQIRQLQAVIRCVIAADQFAPKIQIDGLGAGRRFFCYCHALCLPRFARRHDKAIRPALAASS